MISCGGSRTEGWQAPLPRVTTLSLPAAFCAGERSRAHRRKVPDRRLELHGRPGRSARPFVGESSMSLPIFCATPQRGKVGVLHKKSTHKKSTHKKGGSPCVRGYKLPPLIDYTLTKKVTNVARKKRAVCSPLHDYAENIRLTFHFLTGEAWHEKTRSCIRCGSSILHKPPHPEVICNLCARPPAAVHALAAIL
jgi:hypothetical protein